MKVNCDICGNKTENFYICDICNAKICSKHSMYQFWSDVLGEHVYCCNLCFITKTDEMVIDNEDFPENFKIDVTRIISIVRKLRKKYGTFDKVSKVWRMECSLEEMFKFILEELLRNVKE